jgi:membrane protein DedA with SNARE-associated domain
MVSFSFTQELFEAILVVMQTIGLPGLFALMLVESFGIPPLPSEVILPFAGFLIATGFGPAWWADYTWPTVMAVALLGGLAGAIIAYEIGRWGGPAFVRRLGRRLGLDESDLVRAERFFEVRGPITVFVARLIPLARAYISYPAGAARMNRARFAVYTVVGATPFTAAMVAAGVLLGAHYTELEGYFRYLDVAVVVGGVALVIAIYLRHRRRARQRSETLGAGGGP